MTCLSGKLRLSISASLGLSKLSIARPGSKTFLVVSQLTREVSELTKINSQLTREVSELTKIVSQLTREVSELTKFISQLTREVSELTKINSQLTREVSELTKIISQLMRERGTSFLCSLRMELVFGRLPSFAGIRTRAAAAWSKKNGDLPGCNPIGPVVWQAVKARCSALPTPGWSWLWPCGCPVRQTVGRYCR